MAFRVVDRDDDIRFTEPTLADWMAFVTGAGRDMSRRVVHAQRHRIEGHPRLESLARWVERSAGTTPAEAGPSAGTAIGREPTDR